MTIFDRIYKLAKKTSRALLNKESLSDLDETNLFGEETKLKIQHNLSDEKIKENLEFLNQIDKEKDWKRIKSQLKSHKKVSIPKAYAMAASIALLISLGYVISKNSFRGNKPTVKGNKIEIGTDKATLTLSDGQDIELEKGSTYKNNIVQSNGEELVYTTGKNEQVMMDYNYLTVPKGGQFQIKLSDGTIVTLNSDSKLKYPIAFAFGETRTVELLYGEAYFDVSPSTAHNGSSFRLRTQMQQVEVLGTEFNVKAYADENQIYTTLIEGKVVVDTENSTKQLSPGEQSILDTTTQSMVVAKVDVDYDISWIKGNFNFKDKPLKEIMKVLSRWYDVEVSFENKTLEKVKFNGVLSRNQNIEDILAGIKKTKFINAYEIKDNKIKIK